jgi:hypothetical protein
MPSDWPSYNGKSLFETNFTTKLAKILLFSSSSADLKIILIMKNLLFKGFFALACLMSLTLQAQVPMSGRVTHYCTGDGYKNATVYIAGRDDNNSPIVSYVKTDANGYWSASFPCVKSDAQTNLAFVSILKPILVSGTHSIDNTCGSSGGANLDFTVVPNLPTLKYRPTFDNNTTTNIVDGTVVTGCQDGTNGAAFTYSGLPDMYYRVVVYHSDVYGNNLGVAAASTWRGANINIAYINEFMGNLPNGNYLVQLEENCDGSNFSQKWGGPINRITLTRGASQYDVDFSFGVFQSVDGNFRNYPGKSWNANQFDGVLGRSNSSDINNIPFIGPKFSTIYLNSGTGADKAAVTSYTLKLYKDFTSSFSFVADKQWTNVSVLPNLLYLSELVGPNYFEDNNNVDETYYVEFTAMGPCGQRVSTSRFKIMPPSSCPGWPNCFTGGSGNDVVESLKIRLKDPTNTLESKRNIEETLASISSIMQGKNNLPNVHVFPNPTNGNTNLSFSVNEANNVEVQLYDIAGKLMATALPKQYFEKGTHQTTLPTEGVAKGVYIYKVVIGKEIVSGKVVKL